MYMASFQRSYSPCPYILWLGGGSIFLFEGKGQNTYLTIYTCISITKIAIDYCKVNKGKKEKLDFVTDKELFE